MREIALHLLDIAENSAAAQAGTVCICVQEDLPADRLRVCVEDDGQGMDAALLARVCDPFTTSRTTRKVGLGIPLFKAAAEACGGWLTIQSEPGRGTRLEVEFQHSHIDRMPLGDLAGTLLTLLVAHPQIRWLFTYERLERGGGEPRRFEFDSQPVMDELGDIPLTEPEVLAFLRSYLEQGLAQPAALEAPGM